MIGMIGPQDHWQAEMQKLSKAGLIHLAEVALTIYCRDIGRAELLASVKGAKRIGRSIDLIKRVDLYDADPDMWLKNSLQRRLSALKSARKRKKERKSK